MEQPSIPMSYTATKAALVQKTQQQIQPMNGLSSSLSNTLTKTKSSVNPSLSSSTSQGLKNQSLTKTNKSTSKDANMQLVNQPGMAFIPVQPTYGVVNPYMNAHSVSTSGLMPVCAGMNGNGVVAMQQFPGNAQPSVNPFLLGNSGAPYTPIIPGVQNMPM